jgi:hypothetical protein
MTCWRQRSEQVRLSERPWPGDGEGPAAAGAGALADLLGEEDSQFGERPGHAGGDQFGAVVGGDHGLRLLQEPAVPDADAVAHFFLPFFSRRLAFFASSLRRFSSRVVARTACQKIASMVVVCQVRRPFCLTLTTLPPGSRRMMTLRPWW